MPEIKLELPKNPSELKQYLKELDKMRAENRAQMKAEQLSSLELLKDFFKTVKFIYEVPGDKISLCIEYYEKDYFNTINITDVRLIKSAEDSKKACDIFIKKNNLILEAENNLNALKACIEKPSSAYEFFTSCNELSKGLLGISSSLSELQTKLEKIGESYESETM